ncbi:MAG: hypothetical protein AB7L76_07865 [Burkholderiaceae bacterium]
MNDEKRGSAEAGAASDASGKAAPVLERVASTAHAKVDGMAARAEEVAAKAPEAIERVRSSANQAIDAVHDRSLTLAEFEQEMMERARGCVRDHPMTSLAVGVAAGWVLGRLAGSRWTSR